MIKKILKILLLGIMLFVFLLVLNTFRLTSRQKAIQMLPAPELAVSSIQNFQKAIRFKTISFQDSSQLDSTQFIGFHQFLEEAYPLVHRTLKKERVNN